MQTQAIKAGGVIYCSGQIPANEKGELIEGSIADKTRCCAQNIKAILEEAGSSLDKIVKCNVFLDDMANFAEMNGEYEKWFSHKPARSCVAVSILSTRLTMLYGHTFDSEQIKSLPKGVPVEIECKSKEMISSPIGYTKTGSRHCFGLISKASAS